MATRILMVCLGNICRSPLAEGILQSKVKPNKVIVDSAGTGSYHLGNPPDIRSIQVADKYGIDISSQRCRQFTVDDFRRFDYIYAMDRSNYTYIISLATNEIERSKVQLIMNKVDLNINEVPDPFYDGDDGFEHVFKMLNTACDIIATEMESNI